MDYGKWHEVNGAELEEAAAGEESLEQILLPCQAVYVWRHACRVSPAVSKDPDLFYKWVNEHVSLPFGDVSSRRMSHFLEVEKLILRGAPLSNEKKKVLKNLVYQSKGRKWLSSFMNSNLAVFIPPLYVGESGNLPSRVRDHLNGQTGFGNKIIENRQLSFSDLTLSYFALGAVREDEDSSKSVRDRRQLLEMILTNLTISGFVDRRG